MKSFLYTFIISFFPVFAGFAQSGNCPQPDYCDRECWAPGGICPEDATPEYTDVQFIIVHHSAANYPADQDYKAVVRSYWDYHVNTHGWDDIGYNWLIDPNGIIYEGRGKDTKGAHFSGANSNTMGVCVIGDYMTAVPTNISIEQLENLIAWEATRKNIDVLTTGYHDASGLTLYHVSGHRDGPVSTSCPGDNLYALLPQIRTAVSQYSCYNGQSEGPANDLCENAIELTSQENEEFFLGTLDKAGYEYILQKPSCDDFATPTMKDVFYKFKAIEDTHYIKVQAFDDVDAVVSIYEGEDCNNLNEIACADNGGGAGGEEYLEVSGLEPGKFYTIRIYDYGNELPDNPNFRIAVTHAALGIEGPNRDLFKIYPNPARESLIIENKTNPIKNIEIFNIHALPVLKKEGKESREKLDISGLPPGIYFIQVKDLKGNQGIYKFIKN